MIRPFVVVSGLPGSGKSTLARQLASALTLPLLDKDAILERLFASRPFPPDGTGDIDWRRTLSRESDVILQAEATASNGAMIVSHWRLPGMPSNSGTPTRWLSKLAGNVVNVKCECSVELAAERFLQRQRHPGHPDQGKSRAEVVAGIRALANPGPLNLGLPVVVDTSLPPRLDVVLHDVEALLKRHGHRIRLRGDAI